MTNRLTKDEFKKSITEYFTKGTGLTISAAKKQIKAAMTIDKYGNTENERIKHGNVHLFYCNNPNYCGGLKNGYGKGFYISNCGFTGGGTIKI